jgi:hypothetical protein
VAFGEVFSGESVWEKKLMAEDVKSVKNKQLFQEVLQ